jgi:hypothetical protein
MKLLHPLLGILARSAPRSLSPGRLDRAGMPWIARVASAVACLVLVAATAGPAWAVPQSVSLELPDLLVDPGDTIAVSLDVTDWLGVDDVSVVKLCVQYQANLLELRSAALGSAYAPAVPPGAFEMNLDTPGLACISINSAEPVPLAVGSLLDLSFVVHPLAHDGEVSPLEVVGTDGAEPVVLERFEDPPPGIKVEVIEGSVTVVSGPSCVQGDARVDGIVNTADAIVILRIVTDLIPDPTEEQLCGADANLDRVVNTGDAITVLRKVVGLPTKGIEPAGHPRARLVQDAGGVRLLLENATGLYGLDVDLAFDPATTGLEALPAAAVGVRLEAEPRPGLRRVRWASGVALVAGGEDEGDGRLALALPATVRGDGAAVSVAALAGYDGHGDEVFIELEGSATAWLVPGSAGPASRPARLAVESYPNPFNPSTTLRFEMPVAGHARVDIHDATGKKVATLLDASLPAGPVRVRWNGTDAGGRLVSSGVYYAHVRAARLTASQRLVLLK